MRKKLVVITLVIAAAALVSAVAVYANGGTSGSIEAKGDSTEFHWTTVTRNKNQVCTAKTPPNHAFIKIDEQLTGSSSGPDLQEGGPSPLTPDPNVVSLNGVVDFTSGNGFVKFDDRVVNANTGKDVERLKGTFAVGGAAKPTPPPGNPIVSSAAVGFGEGDVFPVGSYTNASVYTNGWGDLDYIIDPSTGTITVQLGTGFWGGSSSSPNDSNWGVYVPKGDLCK